MGSLGAGDETMITTPTLSGRWKTRLIILSTVGLALTFIFSAIFESQSSLYVALLYWLVMGFGLDIFYSALQRFRWDHDWPPLYSLLVGVVEGIILWTILQAHPPGITYEFSIWQFALVYLSIRVAGFLESTILLPILFPNRRFNGGEWF